jgi:hypothetical protein
VVPAENVALHAVTPRNQTRKLACQGIVLMSLVLDSFARKTCLDTVAKKLDSFARQAA